MNENTTITLHAAAHTWGTTIQSIYNNSFDGYLMHQGDLKLGKQY